jgi:hypothetical protein
MLPFYGGFTVPTSEETNTYLGSVWTGLQVYNKLQNWALGNFKIKNLNNCICPQKTDDANMENSQNMARLSRMSTGADRFD